MRLSAQCHDVFDASALKTKSALWSMLCQTVATTLPQLVQTLWEGAVQALDIISPVQVAVPRTQGHPRPSKDPTRRLYSTLLRVAHEPMVFTMKMAE